MFTLYGAEVSYFTGKARAYLDWRGVDFREEVATREVYRDVIMANVGWPVIPVLKTPTGAIIQDTADIIETVEAETMLSPPALPGSAVQKFTSLLLQLFADEWLVLPAMHYRWSYNEDWAYGEFGKLSAPHLTAQEQYELGRKNGASFKGALPVLGVSAATIPGIETSYEAFLAELSAHLEHHTFLLGGHPTLGDFSFYGPLYAHLYRDPTSGELMKRLAPRVVDWVLRIQAGSKGGGELLAGDAIPETLLPILARQMREQLPALAQTMTLYEGWAVDADSGDVVPRALGDIAISIEGCSGSAKARSFPLWRLQAATDAYDAMTPEDKARADDLLDQIGGGLLKTLRPARRLDRKNYRVVLG